MKKIEIDSQILNELIVKRTLSENNSYSKKSMLLHRSTEVIFSKLNWDEAIEAAELSVIYKIPNVSFVECQLIGATDEISRILAQYPIEKVEFIHCKDASDGIPLFRVRNMAEIFSKLYTMHYLGLVGSISKFAGFNELDFRKKGIKEVIDVYHQSNKTSITLDLSENFASMSMPDRKWLLEYVAALNGDKIPYNASVKTLLKEDGILFPQSQHEAGLIILIGEYAHEGCELIIHF